MSGTSGEDSSDWVDPATEEEREIKYLTENTDLSPNQARELVRRHGTDRVKLLAVARTMKAEG